MLRPVDVKLGFVGLAREFFRFRVASLCVQGCGEVGLHLHAVGVVRPLPANLTCERFPLQFFCFFDMALREERQGYVYFRHQCNGMIARPSSIAFGRCGWP
jgi:hypothetical protein